MCHPDYPLYGVYPLRIINWFINEIKRKRISKNEIRIADKYEFFEDVIGVRHPSAKDIADLNNDFKALAISTFNFDFGTRNSYTNLKIFKHDVSWLWSDSDKWQYSIELSDDFIALAKKHTCPISKKAQYELSGSELILFNYFLYQNFCLNEKQRTYQYHINQLMDVLKMPVVGATQLKNNKNRIIDICAKIRKRTGLLLKNVQTGIEVTPNPDSLLVQPIKSVKDSNGKIILSQKETNIYSINLIVGLGYV